MVAYDARAPTYPHLHGLPIQQAPYHNQPAQAQQALRQTPGPVQQLDEDAIHSAWFELLSNDESGFLMPSPG
jgi:hypothetical protein